MTGKIIKHAPGYYSIEQVNYRGHKSEIGQRLVPADIVILALRRPQDAGANLDPATVLQVIEQHLEEFGQPAAVQKVAEAIAALADTPLAAPPDEVAPEASPDTHPVPHRKKRAGRKPKHQS